MNRAAVVYVARWATGVALVGAVGACAERSMPSGPAAEPLVARLITCRADVRGGTLACSQPTLTPTGRISADLVLGGQGTYVALRSSNVSYSAGTATFQASVTVQNLTALPLGTSDGAAVSGVKVFFHSGPTVSAGTGTVTVKNPDGTQTFTGANQPYFLYNQILQTGAVSAAKTWQWSVPATVNTFAFQVFVDAGAPQEHTVLRWLYDPIGDGADITAVWSASASNVFAVGVGGKILHYNGTSWTAHPNPFPIDLNGVWGSSGSDVFAVGEINLGVPQGAILHYDGTSWTLQQVIGTESLVGVWGSSGSDVFAVGGGGTILHYNGTSWAPQPSPTNTFLSSVWGSSGGDVFAVGTGAILHYNGASWTTQLTGTAARSPALVAGVWGSSASDVFAVGDFSRNLH